jgi:hypothetical protein
MGPAFKLAFLGLLTFAAAFALRHMFFGDVMPVSWDQEPVSNAALIMSYLLLSIENLPPRHLGILGSAVCHEAIVPS